MDRRPKCKSYNYKTLEENTQGNLNFLNFATTS